MKRYTKDEILANKFYSDIQYDVLATLLKDDETYTDEEIELIFEMVVIGIHWIASCGEIGRMSKKKRYKYKTLCKKLNVR